MTTIFLSHSTKDKQAARMLKAWLETEERGHHVFLDDDIQTGIKTGADWEQTLYEQLRVCRVFLPLLTQNWIDSKWCFAEMTHARARGKLILPIKLDIALDTSNLFANLQQTPIDLSGNDSSGYQRLQRALKEVFHWKHGRPPYPGLLAFHENDAAIYHGREPEITGAIEMLEGLRRHGRSAPHFVLLLGASGSGKSSLARAGIMARLRQKSEWLLLQQPFMPRTNPIVELADAFARTFKDIPGSQSGWSAHQLEQVLTQAIEAIPPDGKALLDLVRELRTESKSQDDATLLLVIDQAEELFVVSDEHLTKQLLGLLRAAIEQSDGRLMVLATMRSEFLGKFQEQSFLVDPHYAKPFDYQPFPLDPLPVDRFHEIICKPAELAGLVIDGDLVEHMIVETGTPDALPLLAYTLRRMWDNEKYREDGRFELSEYEDLGGLKGSIRVAADEALNIQQRSEEELVALKGAFVPAMVKLTHDEQPVRQRALRNALKDLMVGIDDLLEPFITNRLLITDTDIDGHETIEVAHEALLRVWPQLGDWINEDRDKLHLFESLERAAKDWKKEKQPDLLVHKNYRLKDLLELVQNSRFKLHEYSYKSQYLIACEQAQCLREKAEKDQQQKEIRSFREKLAILGFMLLVAVVSASYAFHQADVAHEQQQVAEANAAKAEASLIWNNLVFKDKKISTGEADTLWKLAASNELVRDAFVTQLLEDKEIGKRFTIHSREITRALVALDSTYRQKIIQSYLAPSLNSDKNSCNKLAMVLLAKQLTAMKGIQLWIEVILGTTDSNQLRVLGEGLSMAGAKIPAESAQSAIDALVKGILGTENSNQSEALGKGLSAVGTKIPAESAQSAIDALVKVILGTNNSDQLENLGKGLSAVSAEVSTESSQSAIDALAKGILGTKDSGQIKVLGKGLLVVVDGKISTESAQSAFDALVKVILEVSNPFQFEKLDESLSAVSAKIPAESAQSAIDALVEVILGTNNYYQLEKLGKGLSAVSAKVSTESAQSAFDALVEVILLETTDPFQRKALGEGLSAIGTRIPAESAQSAIDTLVKVVLRAVESYSFEALELGKGLSAVGAKIPVKSAQSAIDALVKGILGTKDSSQLRALGEGLSAVGAKIPVESAQSAIDALVKGILGTKDYNQSKALGEGLSAIGTRIPAESAQSAIDALVKGILGTENSNQSEALGEGLSAVGKIPVESAQSAIDALVKGILGTKDSNQSKALGEGLSAVDGKISAESTQPIFDILVKAILGTKDYDQLRVLGKGSSTVSAGSAQSVFDVLVKEILGTKDSSQLRALGEGLSAVGAKIPVKSAQSAIDALVKGILGTKDYNQLEALGEGLSAVGAKIPVKSAQSVFDALVKVILGTKDSNQLEALGKGLSVVSAEIPAESAQSAIDTLVTAILRTEESSYSLKVLGEILMTVSGRIPVDTTIVFDTLISSLANSRQNNTISYLEYSLKAAATKLPVNESSVNLIFKAIKNPTITFETEAALLAILHRHLSIEPLNEPIDIWEAVELAEKKYSSLDFKSPAYAEEVLKKRRLALASE